VTPIQFAFSPIIIVVIANQMDGACSTDSYEKCIQNVSQETSKDEITWKI